MFRLIPRQWYEGERRERYGWPLRPRFRSELSRSLRREGLREALLPAALASLSVVLLRLFIPVGIDSAAHAYQTLRWLQSGFQFWDNYWYDGHYSFVDYSLLYYPIAGLIGQLWTVLGSVSVSGFLFARLIAGRFGISSRWPALAFAASASATIWLSGEYPFALGLAFALAALWLRDHRRLPLTALAALATLLASPLAFLFLVVTFAGLALAAGSVRQVLRPDLAVGFAGCVLIGGALQLLFPITGIFRFNFWALFQVLAMSAGALVVSYRLRGVGAIRGIFVAMAAAALAAYLIPSPLGGNATRLVSYVGAPLIWILVARQRQLRRLARAPGVVLVGLALAAQLAPTAIGAAMALSARSYHAGFWQSTIGFLRAHANPNFRVEVVDTADHAEAYYLPAAGIPIVRGWFRQDDFPDNTVLYQRSIAAESYRAWLRRNAVRYIVLPHDQLDYSAKTEGALLSSGGSGLPVVYRDSHVTIFQLPGATPLLTAGPGRTAHVVTLGHTSLTIDLSGPGSYRLAISYTPYWHASPSGSACVSRTSDGFSEIVAAHAGIIRLSFDPTLISLLERAARCPPAVPSS